MYVAMSTLTGQSRLAALARQAEVERVVYRVRAPAVGDRAAPRAAVEHLVQETGPAPGGMLLVARHHVRRAHDAAAFAPALADPDAAEHGVGEAASVVDGYWK